jgi:hypothetical protein
MLVNIGDVEARVKNAGMPDDQAEAMIEATALCVADEVRERLRHGRQVELDLMGFRKECDARREVTATNNRLAIVRQEEESRERNKVLSAAEDVNGPVRRGRYGLPHAS